MNITNTRIELLNRNLARHNIIIALMNQKLECDETAKECDVCVGLDYAIEYAQGQLEPEN
jgi:hypothetical protein